MSEMVERMARRAVNMHASWDAAPPEVKDSVRATMREVLAELREATLQMLSAAPMANRDVELAPGLTRRMEMLGGDPWSVWRAMIDEALR